MDYVVSFAKETAGMAANQMCFSSSPVIGSLVKEKLLIENGKPDLYILKAALYAVLGEYLSQVSLQTKKNNDTELISKILHYVNNHYTENVTLSDMAKAFGYERHYLSCYFQSYVSMHFSEFVNWYRVEAATQLLKNTSLPITDIVLQSGFQSIRSFNRVYLRLTGHTPRQSIGQIDTL